MTDSPAAAVNAQNGNVYTPKNILVTGGAGFIASHVVMLLVKKYPQYRIVNYDKLDYCSSLLNLKEIEMFRNYHFVKGNILSADLVNYVIRTENIDTIMHFAAQTHVDNSFGNSFHFTETNVLGTHILLEAAKAAGIKRFIHVSTDEVYGENMGEDAMEERVLEPSNPYAASKAGAEFIVKSYHRSFQLPVIITRGNNVYGPHQFPEKIIPKFTCQLQAGKACTIHGNGSHTRTFIYVEDVARAFDTILHKAQSGQIYNIGSKAEVSNLDLAKMLIGLHGMADREKELITYAEDRLFNDKRYAINSEKLHALGWQPQVDFEEGLKATVEWYRLHKNNWASINEALSAHPVMNKFFSK